MDQYPYSIPPGFQPYAGNAPEKNTDLTMGTAVPGQNPYYMHSGAAAEVPPFGYVPPPVQQQQQQQMIQPNPMPIPAVHANGLMPPVGPVGFSAYNNPAAYGGQFPAMAVGAPMPAMAPLAGMEGMYGAPQGFAPQGMANQPATVYPTVPGVVVPPVPVQPLGTVGANEVNNTTIHSEGFNVAKDNDGLVANSVESNSNTNAETLDHKEPEHDEDGTVQKIVEEPNKESVEHSEDTAAASTATSTNIDSSKVTEEPSQESINIDPTEPPATDNDLPAAQESSNQPDDDLQTSEVVDPPTASRSPTPARSLSASTEDISTTSVKKKRRRIVTNDDEDSEDDDISNRLELLRSPEPPTAQGDDGPVGESLTGEDKQRHSKGADGSDGSDRDDNDNDRPNSAASGAASIFQNVVMIPAGGESEAHKRKKIRVLESDDDEDDQKVLVSVDDIGLTGEGADDLNPGGFMVDENADNDDLGTVDGIELAEVEQTVAMDAPIIDPSEMENEEDEQGGGSDVDENEKETSDREQDGSDRGEVEPEDEELGEEEEIVEEGVEMIAAEDDDGEAIGIATDDEQELEETAEPEAASEEGEEDDNRRSDAEVDNRGSDAEEHNQGSDAEEDNRGSDAEEDQASEVERSDAEEQSENERQESESEKGSNDGSEEQEEEDEAQNDQSEQEQEKDSQESSSEQRKENDDAKKSDTDDDVVCQNDLELNTISLLTDEEDDNMTPLPPPKKELPVVRIVNIKKELLDDRMVRKEAAARLDAATSYQQQHYIKKQKQLAQKKREKEKKRSQRTFDNNNPFGAWSSSSSEDEFIPNDIYFGTPDRVFTANTKIRCQRQKMLNDRYAKQNKPGRSTKRKYGEVPDAAERRKQKQKLEEISRLNLPTYQQQQLQTLVVKKKKKSRADRFYDKSQDIPNDIYFGNVNVPLHILHGFADSSSDEDRRGGNIWRTSQPSGGSSRGGKHQTTSSRSHKKPSSSSTHRSSHSPSNDRSVQAMKEYLKIAGFKNVKFHKLWEGCKSNQERANAILRLMQEKGLEGEPTVAKCRDLRKQLQMEREAQVLDTSLIIATGEGRITRRSARNPQNQLSPGLPMDPNVPSTSGTSQPPVVPPESLETLNRMRNVVDPDSDGEE